LGGADLSALCVLRGNQEFAHRLKILTFSNADGLNVIFICGYLQSSAVPSMSIPLRLRAFA
jgi:hypothetical protein